MLFVKDKNMATGIKSAKVTIELHLSLEEAKQICYGLDHYATSRIGIETKCKIDVLKSQIEKILNSEAIVE
jgi:hypothetical protein